ncbi:MAG: flagellar basal body P-ring formation protein FlgA [Oligoflexia bacterium]|nr:flagellar basal body P-ring formation protein FlgA [Oligoflexia bacterium]
MLILIINIVASLFPASGHPVRIRLNDFAEVQNISNIMLGEISGIECDNDCDSLKYVKINSSKGYVTSYDVLLALRQRGVNPQINGKVTKVRRSGFANEINELTNEIKRHVQKECNIRKPEIRVTIMETGTLQVSGITGKEIVASSWNCVSGSVRFYIGKDLSASVLTNIDIEGDVVVAADDIKPGTVINENNIRFARSRITAPSYMSDKSRIAGQRSRCFIKSGHTVNISCVEPVPDVLRGEVASLLVKSRDLLLSTSARVLEDGKAGQIVKIKNLFTGKLMQAKVVDSKKLEVEVF